MSSAARLVATLAHPAVEQLAASLAARPGVDDPPVAGDRVPRRAAVALVLRLGDTGGLELLFVKRAEFAGDPWSGQIAFPGGRSESGDASLWHTAMRETWEEIGLDLDRDGHLLGRLDELHPRTTSLPAVVVRPYVVAAAPSAPFLLSIEMAAAFWVPIERFRADGVHTESEVRVRGLSMRVPSFLHDGHTIWGMTYHIVVDFLNRLAG